MLAATCAHLCMLCDTLQGDQLRAMLSWPSLTFIVEPIHEQSAWSPKLLYQAATRRCRSNGSSTCVLHSLL